MPPDRTSAPNFSYNAAADPRRRKSGSAPEQPAQPSTSTAPQPAAPTPQTSSLPARPAHSAARKGPYDRPSGLIKCQGACGQELPSHRFSTQQHRNQRKHPTGGKAMMCEDCASPQQETMSAKCEKVKPATSFSSRQRKNASKAVCSSCQAGIDRTNATKRKKGGKEYDDEDDEEDSEEEERAREQALKKGDPYKLAEEEEDPWELYH
ncbi:hypothetical protein BCR35DRAFT_333056 [Leucosporidium creatinivorum]|uniref:Stc1 domain-containing protein n=1 Tax=Leucosporidium creatinivorum TaxID=106004 RepID=A0A1Y2EVQ3_9BASI|nr:hypothetical protein BCR35DRAFT_333056 [Leucosporidium creatinivorum]